MSYVYGTIHHTEGQNMIRTLLGMAVALGALAVPISTIGEPVALTPVTLVAMSDPNGNGDADDIAEPYTWTCPMGCGVGGTAATQEDADSAEFLHLLSH